MNCPLDHTPLEFIEGAKQMPNDNELIELIVKTARTFAIELNFQEPFSGYLIPSLNRLDIQPSEDLSEVYEHLREKIKNYSGILLLKRKSKEWK